MIFEKNLTYVKNVIKVQSAEVKLDVNRVEPMKTDSNWQIFGDLRGGFDFLRSYLYSEKLTALKTEF